MFTYRLLPIESYDEWAMPKGGIPSATKKEITEALRDFHAEVLQPELAGLRIVLVTSKTGLEALRDAMEKEFARTEERLAKLEANQQDIKRRLADLKLDIAPRKTECYKGQGSPVTKVGSD